MLLFAQDQLHGPEIRTHDIFFHKNSDFLFWNGKKFRLDPGQGGADLDRPRSDSIEHAHVCGVGGVFDRLEMNVNVEFAQLSVDIITQP